MMLPSQSFTISRSPNLSFKDNIQNFYSSNKPDDFESVGGNEPIRSVAFSSLKEISYSVEALKKRKQDPSLFFNINKDPSFLLPFEGEMVPFFDQFPSPFFKEQFASLYLSLHSFEQREALFKYFTDFFFETYKDKKKIENYLSLFFGEVLFIVDKIPDKINFILTLTHKQFKSYIESLFKERLLSIAETLTKLYTTHGETALQNPIPAYKNRLSLELAKMIISSEGTVNIGIIPVLCQIFIQEKGEFPIDDHLIEVLQSLLEDKELRSILYSIQKPKIHLQKSTQIIQIMLSENEIKDIDAKRAALAGLLGGLRQEDDGTCFAMFFLLSVYNFDFKACLTDFKALLENEKLSRKLSETDHNFFFIFEPNYYSFDNTVLEISPGGFLIFQEGEKKHVAKAPIWEAPGINQITSLLKVPDVKEKILTLIEQQQGLSFFITLKGLIHSFIPQDLSETEQEELLTKFFLIFEAESINLLLKVWRDTLASMAETKDAGIISRKIMNSVFEPLENKLKKSSLKEENRVIFLAEFHRIFKENFTLCFNATISNQEFNMNSSGAFVMCESTPEGLQKVIQNYKEFNNFFMQIIKTTGDQTGINCLEAILPWVENDVFILEVLNAYNPNKKISDPQERLKRLPWLTRSGNNSLTAFSTYFHKYNVEEEIQKASSAADFMNILIERASQQPSPLMAASTAITFKGSHSCNITPKRVLKIRDSLNRKGKTLKEAIEEYLTTKHVAPTLKIYASTMNKKIKELFFNRIVQKYFSTTEIPPSFQSNWDQQKKLHKTVAQVRNFVIGLMKENHKKSVSQEVDEILITTLCERKNLRKRLQKLAITFADANWAAPLSNKTDSVNTYLALMGNSIGGFDLWVVNEENTPLRLLIPSLANVTLSFYKATPKEEATERKVVLLNQAINEETLV